MPRRTPKTKDWNLPSPHDWRTTDADELNKRRKRAQEEKFQVVNVDSRFKILSNFRVKSESGMTYSVEIRDVEALRNVCSCVDYRINGLGSCKHIEAVLLLLEARYPRLFQQAKGQTGKRSPRVEILLDRDRETLCVGSAAKALPRPLRRWFDAEGCLSGADPEEAVPVFERLSQDRYPEIRVSQEVGPWLERRRREAEKRRLRREYEQKVQSGEWPAQETKIPLFPYQREGMLHLAFAERALLADEMGLGKTIQAIAACGLLHRLGQAQRVLIVAPASLKTEWEEQIQRFTDLPYKIVYGPRFQRLRDYETAPFFTIVNYEQMMRDSLDVNGRLNPDVVVLDEAQRIKNWSTKTAQAVKRLQSRYAFVLTGTPIENRIDELHSLMDFLDPSVLGPLFRFNRDFYELDDRGRPSAFRNLGRLHERVRPFMVRRRKADVESELPERTDRTFLVPLNPAQIENYRDHEAEVARLASIAKKRPLTKQQQDKLQRELAMMRMICDSNFILDPNDDASPKVDELKKILEEITENPGAKVLVFSEWERMLQLVRRLCDAMNLGYAWHTGSVPQRRRRGEINAFKSDPNCRVFLSTDSGSTGLNLQSASFVINCDLPWNPAKLEQRVARAWRKNQLQPVTVIHLVAERTIEHKMLETLANKQALADGVLDLMGDLGTIKLRSGGQAFFERLRQLLLAPSGPSAAPAPAAAKSIPADRCLAFSQMAREQTQGAVIHCEERYPADGESSVLVAVVERDAELWRERLAALHRELFPRDQSDPLAPVQLEVIDRAANEAVERLIQAGLIARTTRAVRSLGPESESVAPEPLSPEEKERAKDCREQAARRLKMARLLSQGELDAEARAALGEGLLSWGAALAIEGRLAAPSLPADLVRPPLALRWAELLPIVRGVVVDSSFPAPLALEQLERRLDE